VQTLIVKPGFSALQIQNPVWQNAPRFNAVVGQL